MKTKVARWITRGQKYWYDLYQDEMGFSYEGPNCGGNLGNVSKHDAIKMMELRMAKEKQIDNRTYHQVATRDLELEIRPPIDNGPADAAE